MGQPAPVNWNMGNGVPGSYSGLKLEPPGSTWKAAPANPPLKKNPIMVYQGTPLPLAHEARPVNIPDDSMLIFSKNYASPYCHSSLSTDTGQICTTKWQRDYVGVARGGNKSSCQYTDF